MRLEYLSMQYKDWGDYKDMVVGEIKFKDLSGSITLALTPQNCQDILQIISDRLIDQAREQAKTLVGAIYEASSGNKLPSPPKEGGGE